MVAPILIGSMLSGVSIAHPHHEQAAVSETALMTWDYTRPQRIGFRTEVVLPELIWLASGFNKQARVREFNIGLVADCSPGDVAKKSIEVTCRLVDVGVQAMSLPQEQGLLEPIVGEIDARLTGVDVQLQMNRDGSLRNIGIDGLERINRRFGRINENLRLILTRAFAGLDMPLPKHTPEAGWLQRRSWLVSAPASAGTAGVTEIVHKVIGRDGDRVFIASAGRGLVSPRDGANKYDMRLESQVTLDTATGTIVERTWSMAGGPTPSSVVSQGFEGYPYLQRGRIAALGPEDEWDVGFTKEIPPRKDSGVSTLQQSFLGVGAGL
ncbi:MAG: hypothetical protein AAF602_21795 [Myxococcota bacterium]